MKQRNDYINWDEYFMGIALLSAMRSKDPNPGAGRASPWTPNICTYATPS